jgi:hypothetical protein
MNITDYPIMKNRVGQLILWWKRLYVKFILGLSVLFSIIFMCGAVAQSGNSYIPNSSHGIAEAILCAVFTWLSFQWYKLNFHKN